MFGSLKLNKKKVLKGNTTPLTTNRITKDMDIWQEILIQFYKLPKDKQDQVLLRIYKNIHKNSKLMQNFGFIASGKC